MNYLEDFKAHKLLVYVNNATKEEKETFENIVKETFCDGYKLSEYSISINNKYLHRRPRGMTFSNSPVDVNMNGMQMPYINLQDFIDYYSLQVEEVNEDEIECLLK